MGKAKKSKLKLNKKIKGVPYVTHSTAQQIYEQMTDVNEDYNNADDNGWSIRIIV